jgi:hypothetical protein
MNVATITMEPDQAREKLRAYRASKHKDAEEQYRQCAAGYEALAKGTPLLNLADVFRDVALDEKCRPKLAIAAADQSQVRFRWDATTQAVFSTGFKNWNLRHERYVRFVEMGRRHGRRSSNDKWDVTVEAFALVPLVPADVRPRVGQLKDLFVLWEVENWSDTEIGAKAPVDPMLLKHIGGALYAVLAEWDLTPLERAVLEGAMTQRR